MSESSRSDASFGTFRSTQVLGVRRRHAPRYCKNRARRERGELDEFEQHSYLAHAVERQQAEGSSVSAREMKELCMVSLMAEREFF